MKTVLSVIVFLICGSMAQAKVFCFINVGGQAGKIDVPESGGTLYGEVGGFKARAYINANNSADLSIETPDGGRVEAVGTDTRLPGMHGMSLRSSDGSEIASARCVDDGHGN